ncbi:glucose-6-phosphate dehydrogenase assembly protein OpcA, partial [Acidobacteria bacterium AH-259-O06]|nr:glucose-6-phosphate dehydrogenase assembly protein OpcA [Acidobacteria bacterium AH-259-O06]
PLARMELKDRTPSVDVPTIEREWDELWKQMTEASPESDQQAVMRACVLNLIVYAAAEQSAEKVTQVMREVTTEHPGRVIVILSKADAAEPALNATVNVQCHFSAGGRKQICCEQIVIEAQGEAINQVLSLVRPLVVPDLPVFLWWREVPDFQSPLLAGLVKTSDRVIIDSRALPHTGEGLERLAALIKERAQWTAFSDLNWARLTPWRVLAAGFFDVPDYRAYLLRIDRVQIDWKGEPADVHSIPSQALLLAGWLASRLKWQPTSEPQWIDQHTYQWKLKSEDRTITIQIKISSSTNDARPGLNSLQFVVDGEPSARFATFLGPDGRHLETDVTLGGKRLAGKIMRLDDDDEVQLVGKELKILRHDKVYEQGLKFLANVRASVIQAFESPENGRYHEE